MCGRFIDPDLRGTDTEFAHLRIDPFPRRYNIKPTEQVLILTGAPPGPMTGAMARWWLVPAWHRGELRDWKATTFNARIEDAGTKPSFRDAWRRGRCLIPAGGFYEWTGEKGHRQPHLILPAGNDATLWFAGLCSRWRDTLTCAIVTRAANDDVRALHDRMPVALDPAGREAWLAGSDDPTLGAGARVRHHPVARFAPADDGPALIEPLG